MRLNKDDFLWILRVETIISKHHLTNFNIKWNFRSWALTIHDITGHSIPFAGIATIPIFDFHNEDLDYDLFVTASGGSILGLTAMRVLHIKVVVT